MLEIRNLSTSYGLIKALKSASLKAQPKEVTCILGPNGAGKTTLMFTIAGILKPDRGSIQFEGKELAGISAPQVLRHGLALVPENRLVFPQLTVRENLLAGAFARVKSDQKEVRQDIENLYRRFPILQQRDKQHAGTLSGGEQQMLAVARALISKPKMLLMDEPSIGLAPKIVNEIFAIIRELNQDGMPIVLVEQNAVKALEVADYFYLLDQGQVAFSGSPGEMENDDVIRRAYLGRH